MAKKRFTKKEIVKLFNNLYPEGEISLDGKQSNWYYTFNINNRCKDLKGNLYDIALDLNLTTLAEVAEMKKAAGYVDYL